MAYRYWQAGLHIQKNAMVCIAIQKRHRGWGLQRWWQQETDAEITVNERIAILRQWRREMPLQHGVALAIPAADILQKKLATPRLALRESEQVKWIARSMAQQLEMPAESLAFDYRSADADTLSVTAARRQDVDRLRQMAKVAGMNVNAVTPDACALQNYLPWLSPVYDGISWFDGEQWLWASRDDWGCAKVPDTTMQRCGEHNQLDGSAFFDPWCSLQRLQPPLPEYCDRFTVALALALGGR